MVSGKGESIASSCQSEEGGRPYSPDSGPAPAMGDREVSRQRGKVRYSLPLVWGRQVWESYTWGRCGTSGIDGHICGKQALDALS